MDDWTGTALAVFASLLLDGTIGAKGVVAPEACVDLGEFVRRMARIMPRAEELGRIEAPEM